MSVLRDAERPMSHSEVTAALSARTWDRSTLYRNLVDLAEAGLLRRTELGDHTWRFEVAHGHRHADHNAHFLCVACGVIECLPEITFNAPLTGRYSRALTSGTIEVYIRGQCNDCLTAA